MANSGATETGNRVVVLNRPASLHAAVAALGQFALGDPPLQTLFDTAVEQVAVALDAPWALILEHLPDGSGFRSRSERGFGLEDAGWFAMAGEHAAAEAALTAGVSSLYTRLQDRDRSRFPERVVTRGAGSGMIAVIRGGAEEPPFGTLEAYRPTREGFGDADLKFLEATANLLGSYRLRRISNDGLRESEERFRRMVENTIVGFSIVQDGRVVFMNPALQQMLGAECAPCSVEELVRKAIHPSDAATFRACLASLRDGESERPTVDLRLRRRRTAGGHALGWVRLHVTDIPWRGRNAILASLIDVSKAKELELIALNQERMATLGKVASGIAHEIRNPLSALNIQVARMQQAVDDAPGLDAGSRETIRRSLAGVAAATGKIEGVIRRALNFSRPLAIPMAALSVNECIREAAEMAATVLVQNGVTLSTTLAEAQPRCRGDRHLLEQVFLNLLLNASQAMEAQPEGRTIRVASEVDGDSVVVSVADAGPGVPEELRDRIFEPFFTTRPSGTGIGLSITRKIVVEHGGSIDVGKSALGGALFTISLPVLAADLPATGP